MTANDIGILISISFAAKLRRHARRMAVQTVRVFARSFEEFNVG
jgi:hypothetical protein